MESDRRRFLRRGAALVSGVVAGGSWLSSCAPQEAQAPVAASSGRKFRWRLATTWPPNFPVLGEGVALLAKRVAEMSGGRFEISVYGGGELAPPLEVFDAVSNGAIELAHSSAYYWAGKTPASQFFAAVPFGMNAQQMVSWITRGGGQALWEETYAPFGVLPMLAGTTGVQTGGWFNREINSIEDLRGLKMRIPGLGGKVLAKAGGTAVSVAGGEIYTNLERGVIDATEWIGPCHDYAMGFHEVAKYYYYPGWHEPGTLLELLVSRKAYDALGPDLQAILRAAATEAHVWIWAEAEHQNNHYLQKIIQEGRVQIKAFPREVLDVLRRHAREVCDELAVADPLCRKVYGAFQAYHQACTPWAEMSEKAYYQMILPTKD